MRAKRKFDLIFDLHQDAEVIANNTFLCESLSFKRSADFSPFSTDDFLSGLSNTLEGPRPAPKLEKLHLVDMATYARRPMHQATGNGYYHALESFAKLRYTHPKFAKGVTICGKINLRDLEQEAVLFKYWFGDDLAISLSSAVWSDSLPQILRLLERLKIQTQLMFDITTIDGQLQSGRSSFSEIIDRIQSVNRVSKGPVDVHFCSIQTAGWADVDERLLDAISTKAVKVVSGDIVYSGGLKLDQNRMVSAARAYPSVSRWCIGNDLLRKSNEDAMIELYAAEAKLELEISATDV